jgi:hypothetical protein
MQTATPKSQIVITLVHGTFNFFRSEWTKPHAVFCSTLSQRFAYSANVFRWSGWNSHRARLKAAEKLKRSLALAIDTFPGAEHFVVAHSHGGNIALYAMNDSELSKSVAGIVCLGTPFITCQARNLEPGLLPFQTIASILLPVSLIALLLRFLNWYVDRYQNASFAGFILMGIAGLCCAVGSIPLVAPLFRVLKRMIERHQQELLSTLCPPRILSAPVLCISAKGDEAGRHLRFLEWMSALPLLLWKPSVFWSLATGIWMFILFMWAGQTNRMLNGGAKGSLIDWISTIVNFSILSAVLTLVLACIWQVIVGLVPKLIRANFLGFGGESVFDNWFSRISISRRPLEDWSITDAEFEFHTGALRHSQLHDSLVVARKVADWIAERVSTARH